MNCPESTGVKFLEWVLGVSALLPLLAFIEPLRSPLDKVLPALLISSFGLAIFTLGRKLFGYMDEPFLLQIAEIMLSVGVAAYLILDWGLDWIAERQRVQDARRMADPDGFVNILLSMLIGVACLAAFTIVSVVEAIAFLTHHPELTRVCAVVSLIFMAGTLASGLWFYFATKPDDCPEATRTWAHGV
jgi:hypothetical protein